MLQERASLCIVRAKSYDSYSPILQFSIFCLKTVPQEPQIEQHKIPGVFYGVFATARKSGNIILTY